ncbi:putative TetR family transcriptional regulator [Sphingobium herbicidovorans NBRC 16415]|uniref:TetR family transcriptional regulator n=1 Tax=Sphingobium herbicidovorans (strain ATCC 700291 / DSM 11019 / CCUG 56400 / KCTC 2939 / LMG 18315 / NBRC 16415 / MH) TaxID=1219045 RepID=A0A086P7Z7_SPHHM|nr:putative TetR family transcriptional regulator [Sphingobium herbicidovorans NBRC 16415]
MNASKKVHRQGRTGRPTLDEAGVIERVILEAATRLFLARGYDATSMVAVASAAGVSKRTLYSRYGTKEALMNGVIQDRVKQWAAAAGENDVNLPDDFKERMVRHAQTLAHALGGKEVRDFDRLIQSTSSRFPEFAKAFHELGYRYEVEFLAAEIRKGAADTLKPAQNPEGVAQQLLSMIMGWRRTQELVRELENAEVEEFARNAVEVLFEGRVAW